MNPDGCLPCLSQKAGAAVMLRPDLAANTPALQEDMGLVPDVPTSVLSSVRGLAMPTHGV